MGEAARPGSHRRIGRHPDEEYELSGLPPLSALDYSTLDMQPETEILRVTLPDLRGRGWQRAEAQTALDGMEGIVRDRVKSGDVVYDG